MATYGIILRDFLSLLGNNKQELGTIKSAYRKSAKVDGLIRSRTVLERELQTFANKYNRDFDTLLKFAMAKD